jgi:DNA polymerase-3 subunit epsilon
MVCPVSAVREIVFDAETTGLDPCEGHRLIEVGCIELLNHFPTGRTFHRYLNPERNVSPEAFAVHGLSLEFLRDKSLFSDISDGLMNFIGDASLVAHNASFDLSFLNTELRRVSLPAISHERVIDTLLLARRKYPGGSNRLDDLCQRFGISNRRRTKHGALLDAELLAEIYVELIGARQAQLDLVLLPLAPAAAAQTPRVRPFVLAPRLTDAERAAHRALVSTIDAKAKLTEAERAAKEMSSPDTKAGAIWNEYVCETAHHA